MLLVTDEFIPMPVDVEQWAQDWQEQMADDELEHIMRLYLYPDFGDDEWII